MEAWIIFIIGENQAIMLFSFWTNNILLNCGCERFLHLVSSFSKCCNLWNYCPSWKLIIWFLWLIQHSEHYWPHMPSWGGLFSLRSLNLEAVQKAKIKSYRNRLCEILKWPRTQCWFAKITTLPGSPALEQIRFLSWTPAQGIGLSQSEGNHTACLNPRNILPVDMLPLRKASWKEDGLKRQ